MALKFLKTPSPVAVLLPDTQFFARAIPVPDAQTRADATTQVELALESLAPFPLAQMYYGYHWIPGAKHALAYAAYRKRFSAASVETWPAADTVLPAFVPFIQAAARPATTTILHTPASVTAIHYTDDSGVPAQVQTRALPQSTPEEAPVTEEQLAAARAAARAELIHAAAGTTHLAEYTVPETFAPARAVNNGLSFTATAQPLPNAAPPAPQTNAFTREQLDALDVRDKTELAARRATRRRDLMLWRAFLACFVLFGLCALAEIAIIGGKKIQEKRATQVALQSGPVAEIEKQNTLANRIEDLSSKRLLPFEMIDLIRPSIPPTVLFTRVVAENNKLNTLQIQAKTGNAADFNAFRNALQNQPNIDKVTVTNSNIQNGNTTFTLTIDFKPDVVKPAVDEPPPKPPEPAKPDAAPQPPDAAASAAPANQPMSIREQIQRQTGAAPPDQQQQQPAAPADNTAPPQQPAPQQTQPQQQNQQLPPAEEESDAAAQPAPANLAAAGEYTVRAGDSLASIARQAGVSIPAILAANPGVNYARLQVGQKLALPAATQ